ncbi:DUF2199 domain-containing protein [Reinekea forsetii]|nr:DUF2199 domain-containing protein [Reinekea forsetii]
MTEFEFKCSCCDEIHKGIPTFGTTYPITVLQIPEDERASRVALGTDDCVIDEKYFYIRGCIEIPVQGFEDPFVWGAWVSLSEESFIQYIKHFDEAERSHIGPFFGWLSSDFIVYAEQCVNLKTRVHLRNDGIRPFIKIEPSEHLLSIEQRDGISEKRLIEIYEETMHAGQ